MKYTTITEELIMSGQYGNGGWNAKQLWRIGVSWPPKSGWKQAALGKPITDKDAKEFIALRGKSKKRVRKASILALSDQLDH